MQGFFIMNLPYVFYFKSMNSQAEFLPVIQKHPTKYAPPVMKGDL
jgi:hypothetical protein